MCLAAAGEAAAQCGDWDLVPTPNVGDRTNWLSAVSALSSDDAWAVGHWRNLSGTFGPMAMRWNGGAWSLMSLPDTSHLGWYPESNGVEAAYNGDVWVVGKVSTPYPTELMPLVLRWRSGSWDFADTVTLRPQTVYPFADRGGAFADAAALTPYDIWAVGQAAGFGDGQATTVPLAAHWDGSSWTEVDVPRIANRHHDLVDVVAIAPDDVWAVGDYRNVADVYRGVTYHWDGTSWSHVDSPIEAMEQSGLNDVVATGPNDVWAIGGSQVAGVVLMHWDGSHWSVAQPPPNSGGAIAAVGPNDLWASGWNGFWHWDGSAWTEVPAAVPGASYVIRSGGMDIVGDCDIWCAGFWTLADGITGFTLAERLQEAGTIGFSYCGPAVPNSSGGPAEIRATGSDVVADADFHLVAEQLPPNQFGYFLTSKTQGFVANPGGSQGNLCLGGVIGRFASQVQSSGAAGSFTIQVDLTKLPPPLNVPVLPGDTWSFQAWFRDKNPSTTSNFTDGVSVAFQ